jgi:hypothetical protein
MVVGASETTTCRLDRWSICKYLKTDHKAETDPLSQGGFRHSAEIACFLMLRFQADTGNWLKSVELCCAWKQGAATKSTTSEGLVTVYDKTMTGKFFNLAEREHYWEEPSKIGELHHPFLTSRGQSDDGELLRVSSPRRAWAIIEA